MKISRIPQQLIPLAILFIVGIVALVVTRRLLIPETFGEYGHYRAAAVDEIAAQEPVYAGYKSCLDCHDDIFAQKQKGHHHGLTCETCHGPAIQHVDAPDEVQPQIPRGRDFCLLCHGYNPSRPTGFPQVLPEQHNATKACMSCHDPHAPQLPQGTGECNACHRQIANEKAVSHHSQLTCTTCHVTPDEHMISPVTIRAQKPTSKELCGGCHGKYADSSPEIPRIDITTHGERYLCWDCHYPHSPEARP